MRKKLPYLKKFLKETQLKNAFLAIQKKIWLRISWHIPFLRFRIEIENSSD